MGLISRVSSRTYRMYKSLACKHELELPYIKCAECLPPNPPVYLCVECHEGKYSTKTHDSYHDYLLVESLLHPSVIPPPTPPTPPAPATTSSTPSSPTQTPSRPR